MKRIIIIAVIIIVFQNLYSQSISGYIVDNKKRSISNARIINLNEKVYSYSDEQGKFSIFHKKGDTLRVRHLAFEDYNFMDNNNDTIVLTKKAIKLNEVVISNVKKKILKIKNKKQDSWYALSPSLDYAFRLGSEKHKNYCLKSITIPIKVKKQLENCKVLMFQIYAYDDFTKSIGNPLSDVITIPSVGLGKKIKLEFENSIEITTKYFYLVVSNSTETLNSNIFRKSLNPYFAIKDTDGNGLFLVKHCTNKNWYDSKKINYPFIPLLTCDIEIEL